MKKLVNLFFLISLSIGTLGCKGESIKKWWETTVTVSVLESSSYDSEDVCAVVSISNDIISRGMETFKGTLVTGGGYTSTLDDTLEQTIDLEVEVRVYDGTYSLGSVVYTAYFDGQDAMEFGETLNIDVPRLENKSPNQNYEIILGVWTQKDYDFRSRDYDSLTKLRILPEGRDGQCGKQYAYSLNNLTFPSYHEPIDPPSMCYINDNGCSCYWNGVCRYRN